MVFGKAKKNADEDQFDWIPKDPQAAKAGESFTEPRVLKSQATPLIAFIASILVCLFWNGIVSVFVGFAIHGFLKNDPQWFLTIFMIPFVLIGLLLILWVLHSFLALFNPRPMITMLTPELWLGGNIDIRWQFNGNPARIRQLKIQLEGEERATYRRGTTTHTDKETFATIPLIDTTSSSEIASGQASVEIPLRLMHSFKSGQNEIAWSMLVDGDITFWPNVNQRFSLIILPAPVNG